MVVARLWSWMGAGVVERARLESVCTPKGYRGFESLPIRQSAVSLAGSGYSGPRSRPIGFFRPSALCIDPDAPALPCNGSFLAIGGHRFCCKVGGCPWNL
jgi:hypothetical protein